MTGARWSDSGAERDRVVATLRRELLVPFDDEVAASHLEAMLLEFDWKLDPEPVAEPKTRRPMLRVRAVVASCIAAATLTVTGGFAAAGALPAPAQHWLSRASRIVGIRLPDAPAATPAPPPINAPKIKSPPARTPVEPRPGPASHPGGPAAGTTPPPSVPVAAAHPAPPTTVASGNAHAPAKTKGSESKQNETAKSNVGGNGNGNANGKNQGKAKGPDSAAGAGTPSASAPVQTKKPPKSEKN